MGIVACLRVTRKQGRQSETHEGNLNSLYGGVPAGRGGSSAMHHKLHDTDES